VHHFTSVAKSLGYLSHLSYPQILLIILSSGHPLPLPEGVIFLALGILAAHGSGSLFGYVLISMLAMIVYDTTLFALAYFGSEIAAHMSTKIKSSWTDRYSGAGDKKVLFLTAVSHFVPGWRMLNPVLSAGIKIHPKKFFLYTLVSAVIYPPVYILIGFFLFKK
jgi:membrane protein DedA with SNARE-associated domain